MRRVFKYDIKGSQVINFPGAMGKVVDFAYQNGVPRIWVEIYFDLVPESWVFIVFGTGHEIPNKSYSHLGTAHNPANGTVWHLYGKRE